MAQNSIIIKLASGHTTASPAGGYDMEFAKLCAPTLKELFVKELENSILSGKLEIGSRLPSERELAEMMQVSRAVVNAGIVEMAKKGFLSIKPRVGTFVADYRRTGTIETLVSIMNYNGGMLRKAEIKSILEFRMVLDKLAVQLVIPKITDEELAILRTYIDQMQAEAIPSRAAEIAFSFHHELGVISGNTLLPLIFYSFKYPILNLWERFCRMHGIDSLYRNTSGLFKCIEERDLPKAIAGIEFSLNDAINGKRQIYNE